jgi:hypothetical protein
MTKISIKNAGDAPRWNLKRTGGNSGRGLYVDLEVLAGNGLRQGALAIVVERPDGEDFVWDGNPDAGLKVTVDNEAANADNQGALRGIDVKAQNWGDELSWMHGGNINARHSGDNLYELQGIGTRVENYATVYTSILGIDVNLSDEDKGGSHTLHGIRVRNTDQSAQAAADAAFLISHTSTNGFAALIEAAAAAGDGFVASVATPNGNTTHALIVEIAGTIYYLPVYAAVGFGG